MSCWQQNGSSRAEVLQQTLGVQRENHWPQNIPHIWKQAGRSDTEELWHSWYEPEPAGKENGLWFPMLSTQLFSLNRIPCQVFQPVLLCCPLYCWDPQHGPQDSISHGNPFQPHGEQTMWNLGGFEPLKTPMAASFQEREKTGWEKKNHCSVEEMWHGPKLNDWNISQ